MIQRLRSADALAATVIGARRQRDNEAARRADWNGAGKGSRNGAKNHIVGVAGELAVARLLGVSFDVSERTRYQFGSADLLPGLEVRTRGKRHYDRLYLHDKGRPPRIFIHAKIDAPERQPDGSWLWPSLDVDVVGWIERDKALQLAELTNYGAANLACHERHLSPIHELPRLDL